MTKPRTGIYKNCLTCSTQFYVKKHRIEIAKYCSMKCLGLGTRIHVTRICAICSKDFNVIESRCNKAKYCSRKCYHKGQRLNGTVILKCRHCLKSFKGSPSHVGKRKYCSRACNGKESHKTFKPNFTTVRKALLTRGKITHCNRCNFSAYPQILGVHHKDRNRDNNKLSNLEILCPNCHSIEHMKHIVVHN